MSLYNIANTQLSDTFDTWRLRSNQIRTQAASATGNNVFTGTEQQVKGFTYIGPDAKTSADGAHTAGNNHTFLTANNNTYAGVGIKNLRDDTLSSSDLMVYSAQGNDDGGYIDIGINSSTYVQSQYGITTKDDAYILADARVGANGAGNLVIATGTNGTHNHIIIAAGGFGANTGKDVTITPEQGMVVNYDTQSTSPSTGALIVQGGMGVQGDVYIQGNTYVTGNFTFGGNGSVVTTDTLEVNHPHVHLAGNNASDAMDIGFLGDYNNGSQRTMGFVRDASDGVFKLFFNSTEANVGLTVDFTNAALQYAPLKVGKFYSANVAVTGDLTVSGTTTLGDSTGDLTTIAGRAIVGTNLSVQGNTAITGRLSVSGLTSLNGRATVGTNLSVSGNTSITGKLDVGGNVTFSSNTLTLGSNLDIDSGKLFINKTNGNIGINTTSPTVGLYINTTDAIRLPSGNTAQAPSANTPGLIRWNSEFSRVDVSDGNVYKAVGSGGGVTPAALYFMATA